MPSPASRELRVRAGARALGRWPASPRGLSSSMKNNGSRNKSGVGDLQPKYSEHRTLHKFLANSQKSRKKKETRKKVAGAHRTV
ncbi:MAG: hypothetical protein BJ554DRAFT_3700 [Olpidium bornovanus]|uniref:Uncharacterized protein n=1 Tax=Olpidium bornovanus TaxID=278681 RepID=A0A8H8A0R3_9FUNG|nr:MAG: hypothetical protein BJ554DRAFT_3700 [Olpidium bornovanus]